MKYFSLTQWYLTIATWTVVFINNVKKARFVYAAYDLMVFGDLLKRLPSALEFRRSNRKLNRVRPGENFFVASVYN